MHKTVLATLGTLVLSACSPPAPVETVNLIEPEARLMVSPAPLPDLPDGLEMNPATEAHLASERSSCAFDKRRLRQLQNYNRVLFAKPD